MLLWLLRLVAEPGTGIDLPPQADQQGRLFILMMVLGVPALGIISALLAGKKPQSNGPGPPALVAPRQDVNEEYLKKYVANIEEDLKQLKRKYEELEQKYRDIIEERAVFRTQVEGLKADVIELRADNVELRAENRALRGRGNG